MESEVMIKINPESRMLHGTNPSGQCHIQDARNSGTQQGDAAVLDVPLRHLRAYQNHGFRMCEICFPMKPSDFREGLIGGSV